MEDRIKTISTFGYTAINGEGVETIKIEATVVISDQSQQGASKALINMVDGILAPADEQVAV